MTATSWLEDAFDEHDLERFMKRAFPVEWAGVAARILESGADFQYPPVPWAARWSFIPVTVKKAPNPKDHWAMMKSVIYRVHDCLHQLWGLPHPQRFSDDEHAYFKRVAMCGEVAVLTLTEFVYCKWLRELFPTLAPWIDHRNAVPLLSGPLQGRSTAQIAARLDGVLHRHIRPQLVRDSPMATAFVDDYTPMLEADRGINDNNWEHMRVNNWVPTDAPQSRALESLDGLELTLWMIADFEHLLTTTPVVDRALCTFNRERRARLVFPEGWVMSK